MKRVSLSSTILTKFARLSWSERLLLVEASLWLGLARLAIRVFPFPWIARQLGKHMAESPETNTLTHAKHLQRISWAVVTMSHYLPWECKCLVKAMAGKKMLQRRGIASTLYLGVAKEGENALAAHAWLRSGSRILTGRRSKDRFTVVSTFAEESE